VAFAQAPQRIVSLLPSLTESVCALGACARLVGVDRYSNYPASVQALPHLGGGMDPQIESVLALKPDLVLLAPSSRSAERLQALGLTVLALEPKTHAEVRHTLGLLEVVLQVPAPGRLWQTLEAQLQAIVHALPVRKDPPRVYVEVSPTPYAAGPASFIGETLLRLGLGNITPAKLGPFPHVSPEFVLRADPDLIVIADATPGDLALRPGWAGLRAVRQGQVCRLNAAQSDLLVRAGPRLAQGAQLLADCVRQHLPGVRLP